MPSTPRNAGRGARSELTMCTPEPSEIATSVTPNVPTTWAPTGKLALSDSVTVPTEPARMIAPSSTGGR